MDPGDPFLFDNFFRRPGGRKVDRLGDSIRRLHEPLEGLGPPFVQQRLLPKLLRPIGPPQGAHNRTNIFTFFFVAWVFEKSTLLGAQSVDSLTLWGVQAEYSFNKDCPQSFPGPPGRPKEPTRGPTFSQKISKSRKVGSLGDWICRLPAPLGALGQLFVQQRLPPELPRATRLPRALKNHDPPPLIRGAQGPRGPALPGAPP